MDEMDEYQEWLHMTWGFDSEATQHIGGVLNMRDKLMDKYRGLTEEEREEEQRKMESWEERRERGPGTAAPLCGSAAEIDSYRA